MSNSVLTKREREVLSLMIDYLSKNGKTRLATQLQRVVKHANNGVFNRAEFFSGVVRDAAFTAIKCSCNEKDALRVIDFSLFLHSNGELDVNKTLAFSCHFGSTLDL